MQQNKPKRALSNLDNPNFAHLGQLPVEQQIRSQLVRAQALQATDQTLAAARERVFIAPLLSGPSASTNHEAIWELVSSLPNEQLNSATDADPSRLAGLGTRHPQRQRLRAATSIDRQLAQATTLRTQQHSNCHKICKNFNNWPLSH